MKLGTTNERLSDKRKTVYSVAVALVSLVALYALIIVPQQDRVSAMQTKLKAEQQRVAQLEDFSLRNPDTAKYTRDVEENLKRVERLLPTEAGFSEFVAILNKTAKDNGVKLGQVQPGQAVAGSGYYEIPVSLVIQGTYHQSLAFMRALESMDRYCLVKDADIEQKTGIIITKLNISLFSFGTIPAALQKPGASGANPPANQPANQPPAK